MKRNKRYVEQIVIKSSIFLSTDENYYARVDISSVLLSFTKAFPCASLFPSLCRKRANVHQNVQKYRAPLKKLYQVASAMHPVCVLFAPAAQPLMQIAQAEVDLNMKCYLRNLVRFFNGTLYYYTVHMNVVCEERHLATADGISSSVVLLFSTPGA